MASPFAIYSTGHKHSAAVCRALALGTGFPVVPAAPLLSGGMVCYGFLRGLLPTLRQAQAERRDWVYADRGYFGATYGDDHSGFFRLTRNAWQHSGEGLASPGRWRALRIPIRPWRRAGSHVLVCPPGEVFAQSVGGFSAQAWLDSTLSTLKRATDRPIVVRTKAEVTKRPLAADLVGAHALVTYMSNTAVEAVVAGIPVFCTARCAALAMGLSDPALIEFPRLHEGREQWAANLAANQWRLDEIAKGAANHLFVGERALA